MTGSQEGMAASLETGAVGGTLCWMHQSETGSLEGMTVCQVSRQRAGACGFEGNRLCIGTRQHVCWVDERMSGRCSCRRLELGLLTEWPRGVGERQQ